MSVSPDRAGQLRRTEYTCILDLTAGLPIIVINRDLDPLPLHSDMGTTGFPGCGEVSTENRREYKNLIWGSVLDGSFQPKG